MKSLIVTSVIGMIFTLDGLIISAEEVAVARKMTPCVVISGPDSHIKTPQYHRITSYDLWTRIWQKHKGRKLADRDDQYANSLTMPLIDFDNYMVIAIFQGKSVNSLGLYAVSISEEDDRIVFRYDDSSYQTFHVAGSGKGADEVTVYGFFVLRRSEKPVVLEEDVRDYIAELPKWKERITFPKLSPVPKCDHPQKNLSVPNMLKMKRSCAGPGAP